MPTDLYTLFKKIERRTRVDPDDFHKWELTELGFDLVRRRPERSELLAITARMLEVERQLPYYQVSFSVQMQRAIEADDFVFRGSPWQEDEQALGHLYIASAWSRPGLTRLGATYFEPQERMDKFAERFGYPVSVIWSAYLRRPFTLEAALDRKLSDLKAPARAYGGSSGWYRLQPAELKLIVEREMEGS